MRRKALWVFKLREIADVHAGRPGERLAGETITVQRVGTAETVGTPAIGSWATRDPRNSIVVKVERTDILLPRFFYYMLQANHARGFFRALAHGSLQQTIKVRDLKDMELAMPVEVEIEEGE